MAGGPPPVRPSSFAPLLLRAPPPARPSSCAPLNLRAPPPARPPLLCAPPPLRPPSFAPPLLRAPPPSRPSSFAPLLLRAPPPARPSSCAPPGISASPAPVTPCHLLHQARLDRQLERQGARGLRAEEGGGGRRHCGAPGKGVPGAQGRHDTAVRVTQCVGAAAGAARASGKWMCGGGRAGGAASLGASRRQQAGPAQLALPRTVSALAPPRWPPPRSTNKQNRPGTPRCPPVVQRGGHAAHASPLPQPQRRQLRAHPLAPPAGHAVHALQPHRGTGAVLRGRLHLPRAGRERRWVLGRGRARGRQPPPPPPRPADASNSRPPAALTGIALPLPTPAPSLQSCSAALGAPTACCATWGSSPHCRVGGWVGGWVGGSDLVRPVLAGGWEVLLARCGPPPPLTPTTPTRTHTHTTRRPPTPPIHSCTAGVDQAYNAMLNAVRDRA